MPKESIHAVGDRLLYPHAEAHILDPITSRTILAIALGKYNSVSCCYDPENNNNTFRTIPTTPERFRDELRRQPQVTIVMETCRPRRSAAL